MELKPLFLISSLLALQLVLHLPPALAKDLAGLEAGDRDSKIAPKNGGPRTPDADWNRDLFAIFREESSELKKNAAPMAVTRKAETVARAPMKAEALTELKLQGIVVSDGRSAALIDGKIVRTGEVVGGWTVRRINQHGLVVEGPDGVREFGLPFISKRAPVASGAPRDEEK